MKFLIFVLLGTFHCITGNEDILKEEIKNGEHQISQELQIWPKNIKELYKAVDVPASLFERELDNINNLIKDDKDKLKVLGDFKNAYIKYIAEMRNNIYVTEENGPKYLSKYFNPSDLMKVAYNHILKAVTGLKDKAIGGTCKESLIKKLINYALESVASFTICISNGINRIQNFRADTDFLIRYFPTITEDVLNQLKICSKEEGINCFNRLTDEAKYQEANFERNTNNFLKDIEKVIDLEKEVTGTCISQVKSNFDSEVKNTSNKIEEC